MNIDLTEEEIEDVIENLQQCFSEGYINYADPAQMALIKLMEAIGVR